MSRDVEAWAAGRGRAALRRVRLAGLAAAMVLCGLAAWLGWRETRISGQAAAPVARQASDETLLRLKQLAHVAYLAKIRRNALLWDILGQRDLAAPCANEGDLRAQPAGSPCRQSWQDAIETIWQAAIGNDAPPIPEELKQDRFGSPYLIDQSEMSCGHFGTWCPPDAVRSAGPDGRFETPDDILVAITQHLGPSRIK